MSKVVIKRAEDMRGKHEAEHPGYEYTKKKIVGRQDARQCVVSVFEVPPGKSAYPYHYHLNNEEVFYILQGQGELIAPKGKKAVAKGDFLLFPSDAGGAHKLINSSETEMLVYIDFDTKNDIDIVYYPDSQKMGVWGMDTNRVYKVDSDVGYYDGE